MTLALDPISSLLDVGGKLIDKLIPDPIARDAARLELLKLQQNGELEEMKIGLSAILADAASPDPWTSRARPAFLYVVYILLLWSIPMGLLSVFAPAAAILFTEGFKGWLISIPPEILQLFGVVMTGYVLGRSWEKVKGAAR
jgi:hypothetical protein